MRAGSTVRLSLLLLIALALAPSPAWAATAAATPWWVWPASLFAVTFLIGIVAVLGGVGGGVLFVPIVGGFFPFHLDFVRGAGLILALSGALAAGPSLLRGGLASLRLAIPLSLTGSVASIAGAWLSFLVPTRILQGALGAVVIAIGVWMWGARKADAAPRVHVDALARALGLHGVYHDSVMREDVHWHAHRTVPGIISFTVIGFLGGLFGLGAGWANVPVLNLLMGVPLKIAVGTSGLALAIINTPAAWVYLERGAMLPMITVPSILGVMLGARIGSRLLHASRPATVRHVVVVLLLAAGARALLKGVGIWA
jgi:hypothetical protein